MAVGLALTCDFVYVCVHMCALAHVVTGQIIRDKDLSFALK